MGRPHLAQLKVRRKVSISSFAGDPEPRAGVALAALEDMARNGQTRPRTDIDHPVVALCVTYLPINAAERRSRATHFSPPQLEGSAGWLCQNRDAGSVTNFHFTRNARCF